MNPEFLHSDQCCLYVVDPQEKLMAHIHEADRVVCNTALMIRLAGILHFPIFANTQYKKGIGPIVPELASLLEGVPCPDKVCFNGLADPAVQKAISGLPPSVDTLLLCGVETHICVYQTAMGALQRGYGVWVVADAVSSRRPINDSLGQQRLRDMGAVLAPAEMIVYELLQRAGTDAFKAMLPYLK
ncbi:MAG TPA: isochorismatase family protein [Desulfobacteraceae bacterium]|nr:isochorismatase family protein [Desulfobacteraceae bacterium]